MARMNANHLASMQGFDWRPFAPFAGKPGQPTKTGQATQKILADFSKSAVRNLNFLRLVLISLFRGLGLRHCLSELVTETVFETRGEPSSDGRTDFTRGVLPSCGSLP
jgi:hypothetical protein